MQEFNHGPFVLAPIERPITINGTASQRWQMSYGSKMLAEHTLHATFERANIIEAFADDRAAFIRAHQPQPARPKMRTRDIVQLVKSTPVTGAHGPLLGEFEQRAEITGLTAGLIDDRWPTWLVNDAGQSLPMSLHEFERLRAAHEALAVAEDALAAATAPTPLPTAWVTALLPADVLTTNSDEWRAPTSWELRHIVGEGSFTGVSGAKAAALVGVLPQNFRKYTAADGSASRQAISYAMWTLLLHRLGVQAA